MKAPAFWSNPPRSPGWQARLLAPLSLIWASQTAKRLRKPAQKVDAPVICLGNLSAGGTGKTPAAIRIFEHLSGQGWTPHFLTRGFGGNETETPVRVEPTHTASDVGDEPLLLAAFGPVWVSPDRAASARAAIEAGADILIMDDGFQNPGLHKDIGLVVIDTEAGFGNGRIIPAGPLREPVSTGLSRADAILAVGEQGTDALKGQYPDIARLPILRGWIKPLQTGMDWEGLRVIAFAGIGRPAKFFRTVKDLGCTLIAAHGFGDHATFPRAILTRLEAEAKLKAAQLVTTEKDAVRLPRDWQQKVITVPVRMQIEGLEQLDALLTQKGFEPPRSV